MTVYLGPDEISELHSLVLERLTSYFEKHGFKGLFEPDVTLALNSSGAFITVGEPKDVLAAVPLLLIKPVAAERFEHQMLLSLLASKATSSLTRQVNAISSKK